MITKVKYENIKGKSGEHKLSQKTVIIGRNGSGKTTILDAIQLAATGACTAGKSNQAVWRMASASPMRARIDDDQGRTCYRYWTEKNGAVKKVDKQAEFTIPQALFSIDQWCDVKPAELWQRILDKSDLDTQEVFGRLGETGIGDCMPEWQRSVYTTTSGIAVIDEVIEAVKQELQLAEGRVKANRAILQQPLEEHPPRDRAMQLSEWKEELAKIPRPSPQVDLSPMIRQINELDAGIKDREIKIGLVNIDDIDKRIDVLVRLLGAMPSQAYIDQIKEQALAEKKCPTCGSKTQRSLNAICDMADKASHASRENIQHQISQLEATKREANLISSDKKQLENLRNNLAHLERMQAEHTITPEQTSRRAELERMIAEAEAEQRRWYVYQGQLKERRRAEAQMTTEEEYADKIKHALKAVKSLRTTIAHEVAQSFFATANRLLESFGIAVGVDDSGNIDVRSGDMIHSIHACGNAQLLVVGLALSIAFAGGGSGTVLMIDECSRMDNTTVGALLNAVDGMLERGEIGQVIMCDPNGDRVPKYVESEMEVIAL